MNYLNKVGISLFTCAVLSACGGSKKINPPSASLTLPLASGNYETACEALPGTLSTRNFLTISASQAIIYSWLYDSSNCTPEHSAELKNTFTYTTTGANFGAGIAIDLTVVSSIATLKTEARRNQYNASSSCGISDWAIGVPRSVSGLTCDGLKIPNIGDLIPGIYKITGDTLRVGLPFEPPYTRPTELDPDVYQLTTD